MKRLFLLSMLALVVCCSCNRNTPEYVVKKYKKYTSKFESEKIKDMVTPETQSMMALLAMVENSLPSDSLKKYRSRSVEVSDVSCDIQDDTLAVCSCQLTIEGEKKADRDMVELRKRNGKWLVHEPKESPDSFIKPSDEDVEEVIDADAEEVEIDEEEIEEPSKAE